MPSALWFLSLLACASRIDLEREAAGIRWDKLSGRVVYARWDQPTSSDPRGLIFLIDVPTHRLEVIRNVPTAGKAPSFEPTGWVREVALKPGSPVVAFTVLNDALNWEIRSLALDSGTEQVLFPAADAHHLFPAWSSDGRLAYYENGAGGASLFVDGQFVLGYPDPSRVAWDGAGEFFVSMADATSAGALYLADPQAQTLTPTVTGTDLFVDPAVDPARQRLAYVRRGSGADGEEIWYANIDGTGQTRVSNGSADYNPAWSADGTAILFARFGAGLFLYDLATGSTTQVTGQHADAMTWAP